MMKTRATLLVLLLVSTLVSTLAIAPPPTQKPHVGPIIGGYVPIQDLKDPHIQKIAKFAVTEYNKQANTHLRFDRVIKGETQVVAGANYRLVIAAKNGKFVNKYQAIVYERPWENFMNLTSFKPLRVS